MTAGSPQRSEMIYMKASSGTSAARKNPEVPMSVSRTSEGLDVRRRRILFRAWHRGTREMDLTMGRFADAELRDLPEADLDDLEILLDLPDRDVFSWLTGELALPQEFDTPVFRKVRAFHTHDGPIFT